MRKIYIVTILLIVVPLLTSGFVPGKINGSVFIDTNKNGVRDKGEEGIAGVLVSNQITAVTTDATGRYDITNEGFGFVMVSQPTGFTCAHWWQKISGEGSTPIDFGLVRSSTSTSFSFIHASDTHISEKSIDRIQQLRAIVESVKPDFVLITGDLVKDALRVSVQEASGYYELFKRQIALFAVPVWNVPGNHEIFGIERHLSLVSKSHPLYGKKMYHHFLGPNYYSFNFGGVHFVGLDAVDYEDLWYYGHVDSLQMSWLKQDLAQVPLTTPVITFNHIPFLSGGLTLNNYTELGPGRSLEREQGVLQFRHVVSNAHEVIQAVNTHPYPIALSGHHHVRQVFWYETDGQKTRFEQTAAVIESVRDNNEVMPSGVTLYTVTDGKIDEGRFIRLDKK
jgi:predicted MPP superfamily phosphohydrolase